MIRRINRSIPIILSFALVIASMGLFIVSKTQIVNAESAMNVNTVSNGDHVYLGKEDVEGYSGAPYWRVLHVNKGAKKALLISEYLWTGDGDNADGTLSFNNSRSDGNAWENSVAQEWCQNFYSDVMGESSYILLTRYTDSQYGTFGQSSIDDHIFFLSAEEAATYFEDENSRRARFQNDYGVHEPTSTTIVFDGSTSYTGHLGRQCHWWLRSPYSSFDYAASAVHTDGSIVGVNVWSDLYMRPAFYLDLSTDIPAFKNSDGDWVIADDNDLEWEYEEGELTISGNGPMHRFERGNAPWKDYYDQIKVIRVGSGITKIYKDSFYGCSSLEEMYLPKSLTYISSWCIEGENAKQIDCYYEGAAEQWTNLTAYGNNADDPLMLVKMHFLTTYAYNTLTYDASDSWNYRGGTKRLKFYGGVYQDENTLTELTIPWDFSSFSRNSHEPDGSLALASLILSADVYRWGLLEDNLRTLGFSKIASGNKCHLDIGDSSNLGYTALDRVGYAIASTTKTIGGKKTNVIVIVCRGSTGYFGLDKEWSEDWKSNILSGANGFALAAADVKTGLRSYIDKYSIDTSKPTKILITGHSRGGAVANLLGAHIPADIASSDNVFVYTFACPNTTTDGNRGDYTNINNIVLSGDKVPGLPHMVAFGGNCKYGNTMKMNTLDKNNATQESIFKNITGGVSLGVVDKPDLADVNDYNARILGYNMQHHAPALYMTAMFASTCKEDWNGRELYESMSDFRYENDTRNRIKCFSVKCPVDVMIYDENGNLLGSVIDNKPSEDMLENGLYADIKGDQKFIYTGIDSDLKLVLIGTDKGQMEFAVEEYGLYSGDEISVKKYENVQLNDGKKMESVINGDSDIDETKLLVLDEQDNVVAEIQENGTETDPHQDGGANTETPLPKLTLSKTKYTWNKKVQTPAVYVKIGDKTLSKSYYTVTYPKGRKNVGTYTIKVKLKNGYSGTRSASYTIVPKGTGLTGATAASKAVTVKWAKQAAKMSSARISGYQIQYSLNKNFKPGNKTVNVGGYSRTSRKIGGLRSKKTYYFRVRTYMKSGKKTYYSGWSKVRAAKAR